MWGDGVMRKAESMHLPFSFWIVERPQEFQGEARVMVGDLGCLGDSSLIPRIEEFLYGCGWKGISLGQRFLLGDHV